MGRPSLKDLLLNNVYFDTCVYHKPGIELLLKVIPADNVLYATEMFGAIKGVDPETGRPYDDTKPSLDALGLSAVDRQKIFCDNAYKVYPRLAARVKKR